MRHAETNHPPKNVLRECLASLDTSTAAVLAHLLECTHCAAGAQASLSHSGPSGQSLTSRELARLQSLLAEQRKLLSQLRHFTTRLGRAAPGSIRAEVRNRLQCVLQDFVAPAVQDLEAIEATAAGKDEGGAR